MCNTCTYSHAQSGKGVVLLHLLERGHRRRWCRHIIHTFEAAVLLAHVVSTEMR